MQGNCVEVLLRVERAFQDLFACSIVRDSDICSFKENTATTVNYFLDRYQGFRDICEFVAGSCCCRERWEIKLISSHGFNRGSIGTANGDFVMGDLFVGPFVCEGDKRVSCTTIKDSYRWRVDCVFTSDEECCVRGCVIFDDSVCAKANRVVSCVARER